LKTTTALRRLRNKTLLKFGPKTHILIACFQKSGSTYLASLLKNLTGFRGAGLTQCYGNNEQDLFRFKLEKHSTHNSVSSHHVKGTENNIALMREYMIKPIVHTRNIFDVVISLKGHMEKEGHQTPTGYVHQQYFNMSEEDKIMYLIRIHLSWYFNFLVSWHEASEKMGTLWTSYEELFDSPIRTVSRILDYYSLSFSPKEIEDAMAKIRPEDVRFNVGTQGRGQSLLDIHKQAIYDLAKVWKIEKSLLKKIGIEL